MKGLPRKPVRWRLQKELAMSVIYDCYHDSVQLPPGQKPKPLGYNQSAVLKNRIKKRNMN